MHECPRCKSPAIVKSGKIQDRQRYKCKECHYFFTVTHKSDTGTLTQKKMALTLYLEGLGFRSIGRILGFSHVTIHNWIKAFGQQIASLKTYATANIVELDEMHSYLRNKKTTAGFGLLLIDLENAFCMLSLGTEMLKQGDSFGSL